MHHQAPYNHHHQSAMNNSSFAQPIGPPQPMNVGAAAASSGTLRSSNVIGCANRSSSIANHHHHHHHQTLSAALSCSAAVNVGNRTLAASGGMPTPPQHKPLLRTQSAGNPIQQQQSITTLPFTIGNQFEPNFVTQNGIGGSPVGAGGVNSHVSSNLPVSMQQQSTSYFEYCNNAHNHSAAANQHEQLQSDQNQFTNVRSTYQPSAVPMSAVSNVDSISSLESLCRSVADHALEPNGESVSPSPSLLADD